MIVFLITQIILLGVIGMLFILLSMVWPPDSPWSPWWKTSVTLSRKVCKLAQVTKKDIMYELGSGNGTTLSIAAKEFHAKKCIGIEIDPLRVLVSKILIRYHKVKCVTIYRKSFFDIDIAEATVVYVYLVPKALNKLKKKFIDELKPGTKIVSQIYKITYLPLIKEDKNNNLFLYEIPLATKSTSRK